MSLKKVFATALAFALAAFTMCTAVACGGPDPEELIRQAITEEFDAYKNMDDAVMTQLAAKADEQGLTDLGVDNMEFATVVLDGFDYNINDITVDGNNATAVIAIASKSAMDFDNQLQIAKESIQNNADLANMSDEERTQLVGDTVLDVFRNLEIQNETISIQYVYSDNTWTPVNAAEAVGNLQSIIFSL